MTATGRLLRIALLVGVLGALGVPLPAVAAHADTAAVVVHLATADDQTSITVHVGDTIDVRLKPDGQWRWSSPTSSDDAILHRVSGGAAGGPGHRHHHRATEAHATFRALSTGQAALDAFGSLFCRHGHVCPTIAGGPGPSPLLARLWHVDVAVV